MGRTNINVISAVDLCGHII